MRPKVDPRADAIARIVALLARAEFSVGYLEALIDVMEERVVDPPELRVVNMAALLSLQASSAFSSASV
ncbi:MAG: hypothetical protein GY842_28740 [bacterium]|nr:hypothetical protein [bacterium]